jgi:hypothetical protein
MSEQKVQELLGKVDISRRDAVRKLIVEGAFSLPVVMSFAMGAIAMSAPSQAANAAQS